MHLPIENGGSFHRFLLVYHRLSSVHPSHGFLFELMVGDLKAGKRKATVLPLPVVAMPMMSCED